MSKSKSTTSNESDKLFDKETRLTIEKEKLHQEIKELECIINQCKWTLDMLYFKDIKREVELKDSSDTCLGRIMNVETKLQNDLYKFAGFYCTKFRRDELIFNFTSTNEEQTNFNAIQIFVKDGNARLGKWVMPMSIDINYMLTQIPIEKLKNLIVFIKSCKHNIDCQITRQNQFESLKKSISCIRHCTAQSNLGYTQITLELHGVYDNENDNYLDLIIYLMFHSDKARPHKIVIDVTDKNELNDELRKRLKVYIKGFKISNLQTAFNKIFLSNTSIFSLTQMDDDESPLELNDSSNSDEEGYIVQLTQDRRRSTRRKNRKLELLKKRKRNRQTFTSKNTEDSETHNTSSVSGTNISHNKISKKKRGKIVSSLKEKRKNNDLTEQITPFQQSKIKLKQTKLNFGSKHDMTSDNANKISELESCSKHDDKTSKGVKLFTSTPLHRRTRNTSKLLSSSSLEMNDITEIEMEVDQIISKENKLSDSENNGSSNDTNIPEGKRLLQSAAENNGSSNDTNIPEGKRLLRSATRPKQPLRCGQRVTRSLRRC